MAWSGTSIGIVAEYDPFHNGHRRMVDAARAALASREDVKGDVPCVVVLSSSFTQRGVPALVDKWARAQMALSCGVDLVLELPFLFSCAAAPDFSAGAVDILARTGLATHIAFGMETPRGDVGPMVDILLREPPAFRERLQREMARGASYPKAAFAALEALIPGSRPLASAPNNLLALSYILRIQRRGYPLRPLPLPRQGAGHNDRTLGPQCSAGALRAALGEGTPLEALAEAIPAPSFALLEREQAQGRLCLPSWTERLWPMLQALFLRGGPERLQPFDGMEEGMENLFLRQWRGAKGFEDFVGRCVSARYTRGRIRRGALRLLLGVERWTAWAVRRVGAPYARVLGFNGRGRELLRARRGESALPLITRLAAARGPLGRRVAEMEFRASALRELLLDRPDLSREERQRPCQA